MSVCISLIWISVGYECPTVNDDDGAVDSEVEAEAEAEADDDDGDDGQLDKVEAHRPHKSDQNQ